MNWNFKLRARLSILCLLAGTLHAEASVPALIPMPEKLDLLPGSFALRADGPAPGTSTKIVADAAAAETGHYLAGELQRRLAVRLNVLPRHGLAATSEIELQLDPNFAQGAEGYTLTVASNAVAIRAQTTAGLFYGVQSLLQLLPAEKKSGSGSKEWLIPCARIEDAPRFPWRGLMLDVSRHFFTRQEVEQLLDEMAWHKMNVFHWHLVDDQGWRIEIKKYPRLTEVGGWRKAIGFGLEAGASTAYGPDGRYGGFYTQDDIREVVTYAQARHITIVPEIEMPGHSSAALMAYPQFSCTGGPYTTDLPGGVFNGVYCAGNDESFTFVEDVLTEVFALFPGKYVHIGGDEVAVDNWKKCPKCQARMRELGLTNESELEGYFIRRVEKIVNAHHRRLIGWSEIRQGGLAPSATVMDWAGGATEAAMSGHDVVMSPLADCYFDHYQSLDHSTEPHAIGGYLPLHQVYSFEPVPAQLSAQFQKHILGAQANVWTEYMPSFKHVQFMVFPRLCALAEVVWSPKESRNWSDFTRRVRADCLRLDQLGVNHRSLSSLGDETMAKGEQK